MIAEDICKHKANKRLECRIYKGPQKVISKRKTTTKRSNMHVIGVPEGKKKEIWAKECLMN